MSLLYSSQIEYWKQTFYKGWGLPCLADLVHDLYTECNKCGCCPLARVATLCSCRHQKGCAKIQMCTDMWYGPNMDIDTDFVSVQKHAAMHAFTRSIIQIFSIDKQITRLLVSRASANFWSLFLLIDRKEDWLQENSWQKHTACHISGYTKLIIRFFFKIQNLPDLADLPDLPDQLWWASRLKFTHFCVNTYLGRVQAPIPKRFPHRNGYTSGSTTQSGKGDTFQCCPLLIHLCSLILGMFFFLTSAILGLHKLQLKWKKGTFL